MLSRICLFDEHRHRDWEKPI